MAALRVEAIHRPEREDRNQNLTKQFALRDEFELYIQPAVYVAGFEWMGCTVSHQTCVFRAKLAERPFVIVVEDDVCFTKHYGAHWLRQAIDAADRLGYGAIYGGTVSYPDEIVHVEHAPEWGPWLAETTTYLSSHFTVYYSRGYDAVLHWGYGFGSDYGRNPAIGADPMGRMAMSAPVYMKRGLIVPFIATQISDHSDNCHRVLDLDSTWRDADKAWQQAVKNR